SLATTNESGQYSFGNLSPGRYELRADPFSGWNLTAPGSGRYEITLSDKSGSGLDWGIFAPANFTATLPVREYPIMHPTQEVASLWSGQYNASSKAYLSPEIANKMASAPVTSFSLRDRLKYTPSERDQGSCGNCWAWAGTGVMELDYARQKGVSDRLSLQYLDSNYNGGCGDSGACCGGWLSDLTGFYKAKSMMVPWSNSNAHYQDGRQDCGACSVVSAPSISTDPHYDLSAISVNTIPTHRLAKEEAISNIKNVLLQGKGIWFAYYLPDGSAWDSFFSFWGSEPESAVWQPDSACGRSFDYQNGGGHAVLCVGYDDTDPNNRYWIMLNSWGDTTGRPAGLFRMKMDMNYDCTFGGLGYAFFWMTLDMSYPEVENRAPQTPSLPQGPLQGSVLNSLSYTTSTYDPEGDPVRFTFNWGDGTTSQTKSISSGQGAASHAWKQAGTYQLMAKATDNKGDSSEWSEALPLTIAVTNQLPSKPDKPQGTKTGIQQKSYSYTASAVDPDGDDVQITFDWGDTSTSVTEFAKSATKISLSHAWERPGTYYVRARATDRWGGQSASSTYLTVRINTNSPPKKPSSPMGVASGYMDKSYSFIGYATDPNRDQIIYTFDWGDGSTSQTNPVNSGTLVRMPHSWSQAGSYLVRVMATDENEAESLWSAGKTVKINDAPPRSKDQPSATARTEKAGQDKGTCPCSKKS
ncbi:MAG: Papain family cysteine protease, partial [Euryarchaeota archaeon]|nr:Papain family cysteine protease [Euryarchaeota archaeon]